MRTTAIPNRKSLKWNRLWDSLSLKDYREFVKHYRSFEIVGDIYVDCDLNDTAEVTVIHRNNSKELGLDFPEDCYCIGNFEPDLPIFIQSSVTGTVYSCQVRRKGSLKKNR